MSTSNGSTNGVHHTADEAIDTLYAWMPGLSPAPAPCPEALFSLTLKGHIDGHEALLTARGQTAAEFKANVAALRGLLDAPAAPAATAPQGKEWCALHGVAMQRHENAKGTWYSHFVEGAHCKGKGARP